jgi:hypothetical protein
MSNGLLIVVIILVVIGLGLSMGFHAYNLVKWMSARGSKLVSKIELTNPTKRLAIKELQIFNAAGSKLTPYVDFYFYPQTAYNVAKPVAYIAGYAFDGVTDTNVGTNFVTGAPGKLSIFLKIPQEISSIKIFNASGTIDGTSVAPDLASATLSTYNGADVLIKSWPCTEALEQTFSMTA